MADTRTPIADAWDRATPAYVHPLSSPSQVEIMRALFYAGAVAAHAAIVTPPSGTDSFSQIEAIHVELDGYERDIQQKAALVERPTQGRA